MTQSKMIGNEFHTTLICVDSYDHCSFSGRLYNPYLHSAVPFQTLMEMLLSLETLLDDMHFPQNFVTKRQFSPVQMDLHTQEDHAEHRGQLATFAVRILFRQNASWQGSVTWQETGRNESFRSALELLFLLHSALSGEKEK